MAVPAFPTAPTAPARHEIGLLERPARALSDLLQGYSPFPALFEGEAQAGTLGERLFPGAARPGFQAEDVPAFVVDMATDPLSYLLGPVLGRGAKAVQAAYRAAKPQKVAFFADTMADLAQHANPQARRAWLTKRATDMNLDTRQIADLIAEVSPNKARVVRNFDELLDDEVDAVLAGLSKREFNVRRVEGDFLGSLQRYSGMKLAPVSSVLRKWGGPWGERWADGIDNVTMRTYQNYGNRNHEFMQQLERLGLDAHTNEAEAVRKAATLLAERKPAEWIVENAPDAVPHLTDGRAVELSRWLRSTLDAYQEQIAGFADRYGQGFKVLTKEGGSIPFAEGIVPNYVPHMYDMVDEVRRGKQTYQKMVDSVMRRHGVDSAYAQTMVETQLGRVPKRVGHIELERLSDLPGYKLDPMEWFPRYVYRTENRLNLADEFGVQGQDLQTLARGIRENTDISAQWIDDIHNLTLDRTKRDYSMQQLLSKVTGFQVVTKMGLGSTIANLSQNINTMTRDGVLAWLSALRKGVGKDPEFLRTGHVAFNKALRDQLTELSGGNPAGFASRYLDFMGFGWAERWNRFLAANSAKIAAERLGRQAVAGSEMARRRLLKYGVRLSDLDPRGGLSRETLDRVAIRGAEATQHATRWSELPKLWQNPEARVFLQYKTFAYNQARFMFRDVMRPAVEFVATAGAKGDLAPFLRAAPLFVGAGEALGQVRDLIRAPARKFFTDKWFDEKEQQLWEDNNWFSRALKDTMMVGSLGILGDLWYSLQRGNTPGWLLGPTVEDIVGSRGIATRGVQAVRAGWEGRDRRMERELDWMRDWAVRKAPGAAQFLPYGVNLGQELGL